MNVYLKNERRCPNPIHRITDIDHKENKNKIIRVSKQSREEDINHVCIQAAELTVAKS